MYLKKKGQTLKSTDFYRAKNDKFLFDQVNIDGFIDGLTQEDEIILDDVFEEKPEGKLELHLS